MQKSDGTNVTINNYRTIDFPITLDNNGPMHLSLAVKDQNGRNIAASNAVYFTAHYDDDGKLVEVSSPHPVKFNGNDPDAVGYIEHGGKIYTLPVTKEKYKAMMQEVAKNLGHGVDISQSIDVSLSVDLAVTSRGDGSDAAGYIKPGGQMPVTQEENKAMMQEVSKNLEQGVDILPSIDAPNLIVTSRQNIEEAESHNKAQDTTIPSNDMVKSDKMESKLDIPAHPLPPIYEKVKVIIEEKTTEHQLYAPEISQDALIDSDVRDKAKNIKASLSKSRHINPPTRKTDVDIAKLVEDMSKNLESKGFDEQKKDIGTTLEELSNPQEKIKLLQGLAKAMAEKRGEEVNKIKARQRKPDTDPIRLITENRELDAEGFPKIRHTQQREYANIKDNTKLQTFLLNKISAIPNKSTTTVKPRGAGSLSV